jgi:hypothetical protein
MDINQQFKHNKQTTVAVVCSSSYNKLHIASLYNKHGIITDIQIPGDKTH